MILRRLSKLTAMPAGEVAFRARYALVTAAERAAHGRGRLARPGRLRSSLVRALAGDPGWRDQLFARQAGRRFFAWEDDVAGVKALFGTVYAGEAAKARTIARQVAAHEIAFFGETFRFGTEIDWHADPVTGAGWPRRYHRDVPVEGGNRGFGDVKYVWELNRHQFFVDLAKVALIDGDAPAMAALAALLQHWHRQVPYATGAAWACALEPAFRAWSWMWAYRMALASGSLDAGTHELWLTGLFDHARFLHRHLERYTSPYNHLVGEASALFALGLLLPECREAAVWVARGREVLESTLASQFHPDGGSVEQSTFYHHATLGFYLLASVLGRRAGAPLGAAVDAAIERGVAFSMALMQPDGRVPRIGGADDGKPIRLEHLPFWDFRPYQAIGAALFGRGDFAAAAGRFWEDALWVLGPQGRSAFERIAPREPARSAALRASGYYVVRSDWSETADYLCVDCGEQAAGLRRDGVPSAAHGHADCLSVVVALAGTPVLVDPGFYCYNGAPPWEVHFRKTAAHNTLSVDGRDQARHLSKMAWTHTYAATIEEVAEVSLGRVRASHDGYARGPAPVTHRRTAWLRPDGYVIIHDEITGTPGARVRANFQFAPGSLTAQEPGVVIFEDRFELAWAATGAVIAETTVGAEAAAAPSPGWVAPSLGIRCPAPSLQLDFQLSGRRAVLLSVLADRRRGPALADDRRTLAVAADGDDVVGVVVRGSGWDDRLVAGPGGRPIRAAGVETDAVLAVARFAGEALAESWQSGGTYVRRCASAGMADADAATPTGGLL